MVMTSSVERDGTKYYITLGDKKICSTLALEHSDVKDWISQVDWRYGIKKSSKNGKKNKQQQPLVVGLWAERSIHFPDGKMNFFRKDSKIYHKLAPYDLLILCVGDQCLLWKLNISPRNPYRIREGYIPEALPKALKDFLSSSQVIVVGLGIDAMVKKLESQTDLLISEKVELRDLVQEKLGVTRGEFAKSNLESLAKQVIGPEMEVVKPESMTWWAGSDPSCDYFNYISQELAQYGSTRAFLAAEMASKLLTE